jgi:hypothetical protein
MVCELGGQTSIPGRSHVENGSGLSVPTVLVTPGIVFLVVEGI